MELDLNPNSVRRRLSEFYATLDLACEIAESMAAEGVTPFLKQVFAGEDAFWRAVQSFQNLKGTYKTEEELIKKVSELLREDPRNFLILTHLHRQLRFTNLELIHFLFDRNRLDDIAYYLNLIKTDETFLNRFERACSDRWRQYLGLTDIQKDEFALLATFKKTLISYLGSEEKCWPLWKTRIENDAGVRQRIAEFLVKNEDLKKLIENNTVSTSLERSLKTVNVELLKRERGEYGSERVKGILESAGFVLKQFSNIKDVEELDRFLKTQRTFDENGYFYTAEKLWKTQDKRFDFVLISRNRVQFVIETNYFTTSMSKIREVVRHFIELKKACRGKYRLIYITDGMGWFGLAKDVKRMLEFEAEEQQMEPSPIPFLMNLEIFRRNISQIKAESV
jgi:hypothetical protein